MFFAGTTRRIHAFRNQVLADRWLPMGKKVLTSLTSLLRNAQRRGNVAQNASTGMFDKKTTPLFVVCSPCRCVGKTLISRLLAEFYVVNDRPVAAFDLADEGPQLAEYLPNITTIADISDTRGQMELFDRLLAEKDTPAVIDVSYRAFKNFFTIVQEIHFFQEARHRFIEPLILFIIDPNPKSAHAYATLRHQLSEVPLIPVCNQTEAGAILCADGAAKANMVPTSLDIPHLGSSLRALIDRQSFSFSEFWRAPPADIPAPDDELWGWIERIFAQFRVLGPFLGWECPFTPAAVHRSSRPRTIRQPDAAPGGESPPDAKTAAINQDSIDGPEQVLEFAPKKKGCIDGDPLEQLGLAIVAMLQKAADLSNDTRERAEDVADELSRDLRAAEDRLNQLEKEIEYFQNRAVRAETWLQLIRKEIEEKLIAPRPPPIPNRGSDTRPWLTGNSAVAPDLEGSRD
jgi:hypothetical protein